MTLQLSTFMFVSKREIINDTMRGITLCRWKTLVYYSDEVNHQLDVQIRFNRHEGRNYYVILDMIVY